MFSDDYFIGIPRNINKYIIIECNHGVIGVTNLYINKYIHIYIYIYYYYKI